MDGTVYLRCNPGYTIQPSSAQTTGTIARLTCGSDGQLSARSGDTQVQCIQTSVHADAGCVPFTVEHGNVEGEATAGSSVGIFCDENFVVGGVGADQSTRLCLDN
eukprot:SAG31_NODE_20323_length_577_cov_1.635983_1_plen_104_part_10